MFDKALREAADMGLTFAVRLLAQHSYLNAFDSKHKTALYKAVASAHIKTARSLLEAGANPDLADENGIAPLHLAAARDDSPMVELLLWHHASLEAVNRNCSTALHAAAYHGALRCILLLIFYGALVDVKDRFGMTPLMWAAAHGKGSAVRALIQGGADVNATNKRGNSALQLAAENGNWDIVMLLLDKGADPTVSLNMEKFREHKEVSWAVIEHYKKMWRAQHQSISTQTQTPSPVQAQAPSGPLSQPEAHAPRRPRFFTGTIPETGQRIVFKEQLLSPDGNCGFAAFTQNASPEQVAQLRTDVAKTLWQLRNNAADRQALAEEIMTLILDREWFHRRTGAETSTGLDPNLSNEAKAIAALYMVYTDSNQEEIKETIDAYCQSKRLYTYYVARLKDLYWLGPASACLYARKKGVNVVIWRPGREDGQLVVERRQENANGPTLHLFHKPGFNHFDKLVPVPEPAIEQQAAGESTQERPASALAVRNALLRSLNFSIAAGSPKSDTDSSSSEWSF